MTNLSDLKGLGPKSEKLLNELGICSESELRDYGPIRAFIKLKKECSVTPSLNLLYAMVGALENKHWIEISRTEKGRLLLELDGYNDLAQMLYAEGIEIEI